MLLVVALVAAIATGAYLLRREDTGAGTTTASARCTPAPAAALPSAAPPAAAKPTPQRLPAPAQVRFRLLNGSGRNALARTVGDELARRAFKVVGMGNAPRPLTGASRVYFGPGGRPAALLVSAQVLGSSVVPVPTAGRGAVDVVLGSTFVRLRTPPEAAAYAHQLATVGAPTTVPAATAAPRPTPSASCR
jgi:hypothetical protein